MDDIQQENVKLRVNLDTSERIGVHQRKEIDDFEIRIDQLELENSALRTTINQSAEHYAQESEALTAKHKWQIELLEDQMSALHKKCFEFEKENRLIEETLRISKVTYEQTLADNKELKGQLRDLESQLANATQKLLILKQSCENSIDNLELNGTLNPKMESDSNNSISSRYTSQAFSIKLNRVEPESIRLSFTNVRPKTFDYGLKNPLLSSKMDRFEVYDYGSIKIDASPTFSECAYLWTKGWKMLIILACSQSKIILFEYGNLRDPILTVKYDSLLNLSKVPDCPNLNVISFLDRHGNEHNIVLEIYPADHFISFLLKVKSFTVNKISSRSYNFCSRLSSNLVFASLLCRNDNCGFFDMKTEGFFETWQPVFVICKQSLFIILSVEKRDKLVEEAIGTHQCIVLSLKRISVIEATDISDPNHNPIMVITTGRIENPITLRANCRSQHEQWLDYFENRSHSLI